MMAGMLTQLPLPLLPAPASEIAPGVGRAEGPARAPHGHYACRRRGICARTRSPHRLRRHPASRRRIAHPARPAHSAPPHQGSRRPLQQLNQAAYCYPGTDLVLHYQVKPHPVAIANDGFDGFAASWRDWLAAITLTLTARPHAARRRCGRPRTSPPCSSATTGCWA